MRRLPSHRMLDQAILSRTWSLEDVRRVGVLLATFYANAQPISITTDDYLNQLKEELRSSRDELAKRKNLLSGELVESAITSGLGFMEKHVSLLDHRIKAKKIIEGHGDLRPEHICLEDEPAIIDCLEFDRNLRILDPASELMFLKLECDRLEGPEIGEFIFRTYCDRTGDNPPLEVLDFYRTYHAAVRSKVAIWHLRDHTVRDVRKWVRRAEEYLEMAA